VDRGVEGAGTGLDGDRERIAEAGGIPTALRQPLFGTISGELPDAGSLLELTTGIPSG
jgi:hypothetical protein